jgi:hypothetical protein
MNKTIGYCALILSIAVVLVLAAAAPTLHSDSTDFLKGFVGAELLGVLGIILPITLGSAASVHLALNQIEEKHKAIVFVDTRAELHSTAYSMIWLFAGAVIIVIAKSLLAKGLPWAQSLFNGAALVVLEWYILILISLTEMVFAIKADLDDTSP